MPPKKLELELTLEEALHLLQFSMVSTKKFVDWTEEAYGAVNAEAQKRVRLAKRLYKTLTELYPSLTTLVESEWAKIKDIDSP
ncbi:MAG: hypothetical protein JW878_02880 [Methanomicrobia archaeon]|nr:hypothetical protein [Methanomicrobia archaeon]